MNQEKAKALQEEQTRPVNIAAELVQLMQIWGFDKNKSASIVKHMKEIIETHTNGSWQLLVMSYVNKGGKTQ
jgi:hypothetical protein